MTVSEFARFASIDEAWLRQLPFGEFCEVLADYGFRWAPIGAVPVCGCDACTAEGIPTHCDDDCPYCEAKGKGACRV